MLYEFQMNFHMVYVVKLLFLLLPVFLWFFGIRKEYRGEDFLESHVSINSYIVVDLGNISV